MAARGPIERAHLAQARLDDRPNYQLRNAHAAGDGDRFVAELKALEPMQTDGLLTLDSDRIEVLPRGRLLIRNICMVFDAYLSPDRQRTNFSRVI